MKEKILSIISENCGKQVFDSEKIEDLGLDSLEFVQLFVELSREGIDIPQDKWSTLETVTDIINAA